MLIFPHMPKAAGQTILDYLVLIFGEDSIAVDYTGAPIRYSEAVIKVNPGFKKKIKQVLASNAVTRPLLQKIQKQRARGLHIDDVSRLEEKGIQVLYGHFPFEKYIEMFPNAETAIILRDPWKRAISHYLYWRDEYYNIQKDLPAWFSPETSLEAFLNNPEIINIQSKYLQGVNLNEVTMVGTMENLNEFVTRLFNRYGLTPPAAEIRRNCSRSELDMNPIELERLRVEFEEKNQMDRMLYEHAKELSREQAMERLSELVMVDLVNV